MKNANKPYKKEFESKGLIPPSAINLEEAIIGGMLIDKSAIDKVLMIIHDSDVFYNDANKLVFEAIKVFILRLLVPT